MLEDGTDRLSQNVGRELPLLTVYNPEERISLTCELFIFYLFLLCVYSFVCCPLSVIP